MSKIRIKCDLALTTAENLQKLADSLGLEPHQYKNLLQE
jgi:hypothetical protein